MKVDDALRMLGTIVAVDVAMRRFDELELWGLASALQDGLITDVEARQVFLLHAAYEQAGVFG